MDFELSDDQAALRQAAADLLEGRSPLSRVREVADSEDHLDRDLWVAMADQGWPAVETDDADAGGLGLGFVEVVVLAETLGRHLAPVPFAGTVNARAALAAALGKGTVGPGDLLGDVPVETWLDRLADGSALGAVSWSGRPDAVGARPAPGGGWRLRGRGDPVVFGPAADLIVVFTTEEAPGGSGPALYALAPPTDRRPAREPALDITRSLGWLDLDDVPALRLGGADAAGALLDRAATVVSAEMLGAAARVLELTVDYARVREQFGRPIGSFQAVKHRCADMLVDVEGMRSSAYYAAWAVGSGDPDAAAAASAAKIWCSDASRRVMASALQVHGGIGFTWEHDLHLYLKRAQLDQVSFGDAAHHRRRLIGLLRGRVEAGLPIL